jgi:hypothetical protein
VPPAAGKGEEDDSLRVLDESTSSTETVKQWLRKDAGVVLARYDGAVLAGLIVEAGPGSGKETPGYLTMQALGGYRWIIPTQADHWLARALTPKFESNWSGQRAYHAKGLVVGCKGANDLEEATPLLVVEELSKLMKHEDYKPDVAMIRVDLTDAEAEALMSEQYDKVDPTTKLHKCPLPHRLER